MWWGLPHIVCFCIEAWVVTSAIVLSFSCGRIVCLCIEAWVVTHWSVPTFFLDFRLLPYGDMSCNSYRDTALELFPPRQQEGGLNFVWEKSFQKVAYPISRKKKCETWVAMIFWGNSHLISIKNMRFHNTCSFYLRFWDYILDMWYIVSQYFAVCFCMEAWFENLFSREKIEYKSF